VANDTTRPTVTINQASTQADPTSASPINFTVAFSESVSGFTGSDVTIGGTAAGTKTRTVTGGPRTYNVAVSGMTSSGTVIATIGAGVAQDAAGNTNTASTSSDNTVTFNLPDTTRPTVTINQASTQADPTSVSPIKFTVVFSESVNGFTADDVTISGTAGGTKTVTLTCGSNTYCVQVSGMTTGGTVIATVAAGVATDAAGNPNTASTSTDNTVTWVPPDTTRPTVTINQAATQADPTGTSPINFTVVFSESVSGFTGTDVSIGGTAAGTKSVSVSGGPSTYNVAVSGMTSVGTVIATVAAGVAQDAAGNLNTASTSTDNQVIFDATPPAPPSVPDLATASDSGVSNTDNLTNDSTPTFTGTAEAGSTVKIFSDGVQVGSSTATGGAYSITTSPLSSGSHSIAATATDAANNVSAPSGVLSVTIDTMGPIVTINQAATQGDPTSTSPINFTAVFSESVSGFTGADVAISGTAGGTKTVNLTCGSNTYCVEVSGMTTGGTVIATIAAGVATDAAGNTNTASTSTDNSVQFNLPDTTRPSVTINQAATQADPTSTSPINFTAVFSESVSGFTGTDVTISGTAGGTKTVTVAGGPSSYTVAVSGMTSSGTVSATIGAGVAQDAAGNTNTASTSTDNSVQFNADTADTTPPTVSITSPANGDPVSGTITVSANASDNISVAGVRFFVGTVEIGIEDTTAPYQVSWNTNTVANGSHTLTAVARDAAGNATTSAGVTVSNGSTTISSRFEEDNVAVVLSSDPAGSLQWTNRCGDEVAAFSGVDTCAASSDVAGATAIFTFTTTAAGTSVTWIGYKCTVCGIATVSIDGGPPTEVDTAGPDVPGMADDDPLGRSEPVFAASGLAAGTHTLAVTITGATNSGGAHIVVDAFDVAVPSASASPIVVENQHAGSRNWEIPRPGFQIADDTGNQIKGYASATSVNKGESITFHVTVNPAQEYTMDVYRMGWYQGLGGRLMMPRIGPLQGVAQPACPVDVNTSTNTGLIECNWTAGGYTLAVPTTWTSGVYMVQLTNAQGYQNYIPFVVRDDARRADILYQQSVTTYQAYNNYPDDLATGKSVYDFNSYGDPTVSTGPRAVKVSWNRPYARHGSGEYFSWEYYFVRWLERSGYDVKYSTNLDTHQNSARLLDSKAFLSVGHDEYWSRPMYDGVERARDAGVSLGFFSANTVFWQVRFEPSLVNGAADRVMVAYKNGATDPAANDPVNRQYTTVLWRDPILNRPEQQLIGVQFSGQLATNVDYVVANSLSWVYQGTDLVDGATIRGIVGYEADSSMPDVPLPTSRPGTYQVLSQSPYNDVAGPSLVANSSIYQAPSGAWVFGAGTISWSWGLDFPGVVHPGIQRITANVLNRFLGVSMQP
jgi:hypothetical protein